MKDSRIAGFYRLSVAERIDTLVDREWLDAVTAARLKSAVLLDRNGADQMIENVIAVFGGDDIDLRRAEIDGGELMINVFCLFGGPDILVPDTVDVELSGPTIFGGNDEHGSTRPPRPGAPVIRIRSFALFGGTDVWRVPGDAQALGVREARRAARALER